MGAGASNNNNQRQVTHHLVVGISRSLYICSRLSKTNIHCLTVRFESAPLEMGTITIPVMIIGSSCALSVSYTHPIRALWVFSQSDFVWLSKDMLLIKNELELTEK